jgi:nucleoside-triphosphatase THEP1
MGTILLVGPPQSGKSWLATAAAEVVRARGMDVHGFSSQEERAAGRRIAFRAVTCHSRSARFSVKGADLEHRWGRYGIDVAMFEDAVLPELHRGLAISVPLLVDEVGGMELQSRAFADIVPIVASTGRALLVGPEPDNEVTARIRVSGCPILTVTDQDHSARMVDTLVEQWLR